MFFFFLAEQTQVSLIQRNCPINCFAHLFNTWHINHWRLGGFYCANRLPEYPCRSWWHTWDISTWICDFVGRKSCSALTPREAEQEEHGQPTPKLRAILCPGSCGITWLLKSLFSQFSVELKMFSWFSVAQPSRGRACFCLWNTSHSPTPEYNNLSSAWRLKAFFFRSPRQEL